MFKHFRKVSAVAAVSALAAAGMAGTAFAAPETQEEPDVNACSAFLDHPPILDSDHTDSGHPIVRDGVGKIPVVLVHGWTARGHHADEGGSQFSLKIDREANGIGGELLAKNEIKSSFIGKLQQNPNVEVFMFNYEPVSTHWVTDPQIGDRLAKGLECVTDTFGKKAVVVGHSMGGLALREAMAKVDQDGKPISARVGQAITFGTPNTGVPLASVAFDAVDGAMLVPGLNIPVGLTKLLLKQCSAMADKTGQFCFGIGGPPDAAYSQGALAMRDDSVEIKNLPAWPEGVPYTAYAGDVQVGGFTLFGKTSKRLIEMGDYAVPVASATDNADEVATSKCEYGIVSKASVKEAGLRLRSVFTGDSERRPTGMILPYVQGHEFASPCYHNNLMAEVGLTNKALAKIDQAATQLAAETSQPAQEE